LVKITFWSQKAKSEHSCSILSEFSKFIQSSS